MNIMACFILLAEDFPVDEVSQQIGLTCDEIMKKGDEILIGPNKDVTRIQTESSIMYSTGYLKTIDVEEPIQCIYTMLKPKKAQIIEVVEKYSLIAKFCIVINLTENPIIGINRNFIEFAADIHAEIEFDTYINCCEDENS